MSELLRACAICHVLLRALCEMEERDGRTERSGADWSGLERDGTEERSGLERDGTGRDATGRDAKGERDGGTERRHGTRPNPLRLDAPIPRQRALPYITGAVA